MDKLLSRGGVKATATRSVAEKPEKHPRRLSDAPEYKIKSLFRGRDDNSRKKVIGKHELMLVGLKEKKWLGEDRAVSLLLLSFVK